MELLTSDGIFPKIREIVEEAKESIKIASAWIKGKPFEDILDTVKDKNLELEIILRASEFRDLLITDERVFKKINEVGGKVYLCSRLHAKFIISDNKKVVLGSANFTEPGLSDLSKGNIEAGVFYEVSDSEREVEELIDYFESIKRDHSAEFGKDLLGFTLNPVKSSSFEFILIDDVEELSYVEVRLHEGKVLGRVSSIYSYDIGFFANPFTSRESFVFAPLEDFKKIFSDGKDKDWKKAAVFAYLSENGNRIKIATADIVGVVKEGKVEPLRKPFKVGEGVYRVLNETFSDLFSDYGKKVKVGLIEGSKVEAFIDAEEIIRRHLLVVGTTGSGKSYFVKRLVTRLFQSLDDIQIFVMDPHGEYREVVENLLEKGEFIKHVKFRDTFIPVEAEEVLDLLKRAGFGKLISGNSNTAKNNSSLIQRKIKPALNLTSLKREGLLSLIESLEDFNISEHREAVDYLKSIYGEEALTNQPRIIKEIEESLNYSHSIVIYDFKGITDSQTRVNLAGLIMQEIFNRSKEDSNKRLVVLEEAHNFAPERGYGDVSAGKDNLALTCARKLASEGRKFNLGLVVITQRPAQVSKYILSQMNTQAMFRTMNSADLDTISTYVEHVGKNIINFLPSLPTGKGIISGTAVPFPMVVGVG